MDAAIRNNFSAQPLLSQADSQFPREVMLAVKPEPGKRHRGKAGAKSPSRLGSHQLPIRKDAPRLNKDPVTDVSLISVVDDDESIRESLEGLLKSLGYDTAVFSGAESFLISESLAKTACLILDVRMPEMSGPELQRELISRQRNIPIIFITAHGDDDVIARAMADGAVDCLIKPFSEDSLLKAIGRALSR